MTKKTMLLLVFPLLILSCKPTTVDADKKSKITFPELTTTHQSAFDALNTIQTSTDQMNRLYSTFSNIQQPCYPADTSFLVSQSELLISMKKFISNNCKTLSAEEQSKLAATSVLAQEEYNILHCSSSSLVENYYDGLPFTGTWIIPNLLGRRDVIIIWE